MPTDGSETAAGFVRTTDDGVILGVRLTPRSGRDALGTPQRDPDGVVRLRASVTAPPTDNLANAALIALMAKSWKIPKSAIGVVAGARGREKRILIRGDAGSLKMRIESMVGAEDG